MKKILLLISFILTTSIVNAQVDKYVSASISLTNSNQFSSSTYFSIEGGVSKNNLSGGFILGRASLNGFASSDDTFGDYFYEFKTSASKPINDNLSLFVLIGYGGYFDSNRMFIEYGGGFGYTVNKFTYGIQSSNWDGIWYVTPCLTFNF